MNCVHHAQRLVEHLTSQDLPYEVYTDVDGVQRTRLVIRWLGQLTPSQNFNLPQYLSPPQHLYPPRLIGRFAKICTAFSPTQGNTTRTNPYHQCHCHCPHHHCHPLAHWGVLLKSIPRGTLFFGGGLCLVFGAAILLWYSLPKHTYSIYIDLCMFL